MDKGVVSTRVLPQGCTTHGEWSLEGKSVKSKDLTDRQIVETRTKARTEYRRFVLAGVGGESPWKQLTGQSFLGGAEFLERLSPYLRQKAALKEIRSVDRLANRPSLQALFAESARKNKTLRNQAMRTAHFEHGYRQKEIADHLGLHYTTVSGILKANR